MPALDIFSGSAFTMVALTDAINKMPYVPGRIGQLGLFREQGVSTTSVMIEEREGSLNLVETTARGAPAIQNTTNKRKARSLVVPHVALEDTILADEVQNVRAFGSESMLEGVQAVVNQRMSEMATKMDATLEHLRIGAIKGQILDADGSAVIYDLFTEFGVTAHTEIDFDLDNATPAPGVIKKKCHDIRRKIEDELGAQPYEHIHAICGADFFDDLITHPEVEKAYQLLAPASRQDPDRRADPSVALPDAPDASNRDRGEQPQSDHRHRLPVGSLDPRTYAVHAAADRPEGGEGARRSDRIRRPR